MEDIGIILYNAGCPKTDFMTSALYFWQGHVSITGKEFQT